MLKRKKQEDFKVKVSLPWIVKSFHKNNEDLNFEQETLGKMWLKWLWAPTEVKNLSPNFKYQPNHDEVENNQCRSKPAKKWGKLGRLPRRRISVNNQIDQWSIYLKGCQPSLHLRTWIAKGSMIGSKATSGSQSSKAEEGIEDSAGGNSSHSSGRVWRW